MQPTEEQVRKIIEVATADGAAENLGPLVGGMAQEFADSVLLTENKAIQKNRDEFRADLDKYKVFGTRDELTARAEELVILRAAKGKKADPEELKAIAEPMVAERVETFRTEQEALRKGVEDERDGFKVTAEQMLAVILRDKRRAELVSHTGDGIKPLMFEFFEKRLGPMLQPAEDDNGEPWWSKDVTPFKVIDPKNGAPLSGPTGGMTPAELVEKGRAGLGEKEWNSKAFRETFWKPAGKGGGYQSPDGAPTTPAGHVDASAPSYADGEALFGQQ